MTVIVVIGLIIGVVIYKRYWRYPTARPFWTVELKDDHEAFASAACLRMNWWPLQQERKRKRESAENQAPSHTQSSEKTFDSYTFHRL